MTFIIGTPYAKNAGYFKNDDRLSGGRLAEDDVRTCPHCQAVILMRTWKSDGGWCGKCNSPLCSNTACVAETARVGCVPFFKKIDEFAQRSFRYEQYSKLAGLEPDISHPILTGTQRR